MQYFQVETNVKVIPENQNTIADKNLTLCNIKHNILFPLKIRLENDLKVQLKKQIIKSICSKLVAALGTNLLNTIAVSYNIFQNINVF